MLQTLQNDLFLLARNIRLYLWINIVQAIFILPMKNVAQKWIVCFWFRALSKNMMSHIANEKLTEGPRESSEVQFQWKLTKKW